jgi:uncharacterized protein YqgV (UPF0045/DUF77 family)
MGTCVEGDWNDVMALVSRCFQALEKDCNRISLSLKADFRKGSSGRLRSKVASVREKLK